MIVAGLMSGTSADGTDIALVDLSGRPPQLGWRFLHHVTVPHPPQLRQAILRAMKPESSRVDPVCELNVRLAEQFAEAAWTAFREAGVMPGDGQGRSGVQLIGCHGQTVWHAPLGDPPGTLQLGEASILAERTGLPVVSNFRARDIAAGGQGAPLVSYVDVLLFTDQHQVRLAQNIGGIGNVTFIPPRSEPGLQPLAFDTGPGNVLLDETAAQLTHGEWTYDRDGRLADAGEVDTRLLDWLLEHPYLSRPLPKTTGREEFGHAFARQVWERAEQQGIGAGVLMATLTEFTARSIAQAYQTYLPRSPELIIVSGGGVRNPVLLRALAQAVAPARLMRCEELEEIELQPFPGAAKEALAFAILAYETWHGRPGNLPSATGARRAVVLGQITPVG